MDGWEHNLDGPETGEHLGASYGSLFHTDVLLLGFEKKNPGKFSTPPSSILLVLRIMRMFFFKKKKLCSSTEIC